MFTSVWIQAGEAEDKPQASGHLYKTKGSIVLCFN